MSYYDDDIWITDPLWKDSESLVDSLHKGPVQVVQSFGVIFIFYLCSVIGLNKKQPSCLCSKIPKITSVQLNKTLLNMQTLLFLPDMEPTVSFHLDKNY